ncbi:MAG: hypothetical protein DSM107014_10055 [Gomphosphaeria aponina SAG 52.96 = DSM 107014]|uniref:DUF6473 domain-containing protein n=1 Tax=Gomphosphaeria aponina SAG 52.96 = DSM 107014 TaxID=1521640 RepID=A0A941JPY3_9CHRO|nr:hypothetical protein [Gomphosphaeria aponina SAG 52.96 = DSM 107014]
MAYYQKLDWDVVDYQLQVLDPEIIESLTGKELLVRGPIPEKLEKNSYFVCIGAAQTYGRFCPNPYPKLLQERLEIPALNLGHGGSTPSYFLEHEKLSKYINNAKFAIIQVTSARYASNAYFESEYEPKRSYLFTRKSNGEKIPWIKVYQELLDKYDKEYVKKNVAESRENWIKESKKIFAQINIPKILFWFSIRQPDYQYNYNNKQAHLLCKAYPQLVNLQMIEAIKNDCEEYVECVSERGMPQILINRFTGEPIKVDQKWKGIEKKVETSKNKYYPSPEMHMDAANALEEVCQKYCDL